MNRTEKVISKTTEWADKLITIYSLTHGSYRQIIGHFSHTKCNMRKYALPMGSQPDHFTVLLHGINIIIIIITIINND